jgi:hypothetical protein
MMSTDAVKYRSQRSQEHFSLKIAKTAIAEMTKEVTG